jgi:glycosyltransferase involved in cell wall biosynthesis
LKIVVSIAAIDPRFGGPSRTVPGLCSALADNGAEIEVVTLGERNGAQVTMSPAGVKTTVVPSSKTRYNPIGWGTGFAAALQSALEPRNQVVLYDVGLWLPSNHLAASMARKLSVPYVLSPRGMLSDYALKLKPLRKRLAWYSYQQRDAQSARLIHATSQAEAADIRKRGLKQPIAVVSNGVDVPASTSEPASKPEVRTVLFLSRLHPMKGLHDLVSAWAKVRPAGWRVVVAGPDENGYLEEITALVAKNALQTQFDFVGPVSDEAKWKLYAAADLFVLPSYSESFGQVIAEALAAGVPVITTRATPWREIESYRCGWWIETGVESLTTALQAAMQLGALELNEMGRRGREMALNNYSWKSSGERMLTVMQWLIGKASKPSDLFYSGSEA